MLQLIQEPISEVGMKIRIPDIISKIQDDHQKKYNYSRFHLPISFSKKYQVNQVNHYVGKKHQRQRTYNNPNIFTLIKIPFKYLVIIPPCK